MPLTCIVLAPWPSQGKTSQYHPTDPTQQRVAWLFPMVYQALLGGLWPSIRPCLVNCGPAATHTSASPPQFSLLEIVFRKLAPSQGEDFWVWVIGFAALTQEPSRPL